MKFREIYIKEIIWKVFGSLFNPTEALFFYGLKISFWKFFILKSLITKNYKLAWAECMECKRYIQSFANLKLDSL